MAEKFAEGVPEHEFSTAELQGYLLSCKKEPEQAVEGILDWVMQERKDRGDREAREAERKAKRDANQLQGSLGSLARLGITPTTVVGQQPLAPVFEPAVTAASIPSTPSALTTPMFNLDAIGEEAARQVARRLQGVSFDDIDKPIANGATDSGPATPPGV